MMMKPVTRTEKLLNAIAGNGTPPEYPDWPLTVDEGYLYAILAGSDEVPEPLTRRQQYLYRRATGRGDIPDPVTPVECYWAYFAGADVELPIALTHLMPFIKAAGDVLRHGDE